MSAKCPSCSTDLQPGTRFCGKCGKPVEAAAGPAPAHKKTMMAFDDHGELVPGGDAVTGTAEEAQAVFDAVAAVGIDLTDVFITLEDEGVDKFEKSWTELLESVQGQLDGAK